MQCPQNETKGEAERQEQRSLSRIRSCFASCIMPKSLLSQYSEVKAVSNCANVKDVYVSDKALGELEKKICKETAPLTKKSTERYSVCL